MTKLEAMKCEKLLNEAIRYAIDANDKFSEVMRTPSPMEREILENTAHNHRGYAEGINQALVVLGFKHDLMAELGKLIN
ncbi:MAG TPA: hypothetical protein DCW90_06740 [Lachnospiraceae bacterium]|nr:hypothetical protein [Lachnospiraceae bacterium]